MIKFFGKVSQQGIGQGMVQEEEEEEEEDVSFAECIQYCYSNEYGGYCIAVYMGTDQQCRYFYENYGKFFIVEETTAADGEVVAFKADLDDDFCPVLYKELSSDMNTGFSFMTKIENGWNITR
ncbi:hypothetical protein GCK72_006803 [Caenorhabditis remanei]|uniref:PAN-3 domain-containing protein n=1 Tax=Caenorhabditis remanei TaxID=31234 RepID=A0A6A5HH88_CAERE|nr:hypothetical protein GCK72_006803 [Caenorhabditis remanei]KAF1766845.1 hypothetical protein GCK72_006803 [Caenorhabditis remanei]